MPRSIDGYQHFKNPGTNLPMGLKADASATCALWDDTDSRNFQEVRPSLPCDVRAFRSVVLTTALRPFHPPRLKVEAARMTAEAEARRLHAEVELKDDDFANLKMAEPPAPDRKIAHLPPPQVPNFLALAGNRAGAPAPIPADAVNAQWPRNVPPPAPAKPPARKDEAAGLVAQAPPRARADEEYVRLHRAIEQQERNLDNLDRIRADVKKRAADAGARARARAGEIFAATAVRPQPPIPPPLRLHGVPLPPLKDVAAQAGPSAARSPAGNLRDALPGGESGPAYQGAARKRAAEVDAAREAKRARLSGARLA